MRKLPVTFMMILETHDKETIMTNRIRNVLLAIVVGIAGIAATVGER
jgi:hypothetical protein